MGHEYSTIDPTLLVAQTTWVRSLANHLVRDPDGAEDVAQETLLAALASPPQDAADAKRLRAWLGRVAFNLAHLSRRRNSRRRAREERAARSESQRSAAESYVERTVDGLLGEAVRALEEPYRTAVQLRYFDGLSTSEVARQTGTTNSAVRKRLWRARAKLRTELDRAHNGERHAWFRALAPLTPLARAGRVEVARLANTGPTAGLTWKLAGALPLLALGMLAGRNLMSPTGGERGGDAASLAAPARPAAPLESSRKALDSSGASEQGHPEEQGDGKAPRVELRVVGVESDSDEKRSTGFDVRGHVIDLWGNPLGGVELVSATEPELALGRSGANGAFAVRVDDLPVSLGLRSPGYTTLRDARVERGEEAWEQWLVAAPAVALSGRVVDPDGQPVNGATLQVVYDESAFVELPLLLDFTIPRPGQATDADGGFAFDSVPSGSGVFLRVQHPGFEPRVCAIPDVSELALVIRMVPASNLHTLAGVVLDEDQRPLFGVKVTAGERTTTTTEQGLFSLEVQGGSQAQVVARKPGYESLRLRAETGTHLGQGLRMVMQTADQSVQGEVLDEEGQPLEGWVVFALPEGGDDKSQEKSQDKGQEEAASAVAASTGRSAADGSFRLEGLARAGYSLFGVDPETLLMTAACSVRGGRSGVELRAEKSGIAALFPGRVVGRDRRPVADALVQAELRVSTDRGEFVARSARVRTDAAGRFALSRVAARHARLRIDHPAVNSLLFAEDGLARNGEAREFVVDFLRPVRFSGAADSVVLLDSGGRPLPVQGFLRSHTRARLARGRSGIVGVGAEACTVVWYRDDTEVGRDLLLLHGEELTEIER